MDETTNQLKTTQGSGLTAQPVTHNAEEVLTGHTSNIFIKQEPLEQESSSQLDYSPQSLPLVIKSETQIKVEEPQLSKKSAKKKRQRERRRALRAQQFIPQNSWTNYPLMSFYPSPTRKSRKRVNEVPTETTHSLSTPSCAPKRSCNDTLTIFKVEVAPEGYPALRFNEDDKGKFMRTVVRLFEPLPNGLFPTFSGVYLRKGGLVVCCVGEFTKLWLLNKVSTLVWDGPKLISGRPGEIIKKHLLILKIHLDLVEFQPQEIFNLLISQNPTLNRGHWIYINSRQEDQQITHTWEIEEEVALAIKALDFKVFLGFHTTFIELMSNAVDDGTNELPREGSREFPIELT